jgi:hypothetical protein
MDAWGQVFVVEKEQQAVLAHHQQRESPQKAG